MTETGLSLGTPHYMSPEQATAEKHITARSDVYSLASVLYEMLSGQPPHLAGTAQQIIVKIIAEPVPAVTSLRKSVPPNVAAALGKALEKLPADRFASAKGFAEALGNPAFTTATLAGSGPVPGTRRHLTLVRAAVIAVSGVAVGVLGAGLAFTRTGLGWSRGSSEAQVSGRFSIDLPDSVPAGFIGAAVLGNGRRAITISPDGRTVVYSGVHDGTARLYVRSLDAYEVRVLPGTEGAYGPFFSPSGRWIGFFVGNELKKVRIDGEEPVRLAEATNPVGADWGTDNRIVFATLEGSRLLRVADQGGPVEVLDEDFVGYHLGWPRLLPGGENLLISGDGEPRIRNLRTGKEDRLPIRGFDARYTQGYLFFMQGSVLFAARFDLATRKVMSATVPVLSGMRSEVYGQGQWDVADDGSLVYAAGKAVAENAMVWIARDGSRQRLPLPTRLRGTFELAPDDSRLAVIGNAGGSSSDLWVYDLPTLRAERLTVQGSITDPVLWSSDGSRLVYHRVDSGFSQPYIQTPEGGAAAELLFAPHDSLRAESFSGNGRWLGADDNGHSSTRRAVYVVDRTTGARHAIRTTGGAPWGTAVSPDGRTIAYTSDETGEYHIYVQSFPPTGNRRQVSRSGGSEEPRWTHDGSRLFFRNGQRIMEAAVTTNPDLKVGEPRVFFEGDFVNVSGRSYAVARDGQRVLVIEGGVGETHTLRLVQHWFEEVGRLVREAGNEKGAQ
jgi:Tol biopolymer transport system component